MSDAALRALERAGTEDPEAFARYMRDAVRRGLFTEPGLCDHPLMLKDTRCGRCGNYPVNMSDSPGLCPDCWEGVTPLVQRGESDYGERCPTVSLVVQNNRASDAWITCWGPRHSTWDPETGRLVEI